MTKNLNKQIKSIFMAIILVLFSFLVSQSVYSQNSTVQRTFLGYTFCMEKSSIIHYLKKENQNFSKEANGDITLYDKEFGGYTFNWITMGFHNNMFCFISFSKNFRTKQTAESAFDDLKNSLMKKYYLLKTENDIWLFSDGRTSVFLSMTFSESKGGDLFYYVDLSYGDDKLMDLHLKKSEEDF